MTGGVVAGRGRPVEGLLYIATGKAVDGPHTAARPGEWPRAGGGAEEGP